MTTTNNTTNSKQGEAIRLCLAMGLPDNHACVKLAQAYLDSRAPLAAEGDVIDREAAIKAITEHHAGNHYGATYRHAMGNIIRILKAQPAAASSPLPAEPPPTCERCADDANYEPAGLDKHTNLWLHRGRTGEGYTCRLKHPNGLTAPAEPRQEGEQESV